MAAGNSSKRKSSGATSKGRTSSSASRTKNSSGNKKTSSSGRTSNSASSRAYENNLTQEQTKEPVFSFRRFTKTVIFKPLLGALIITLIIFLDVLIAWNSFDIFFKIVGFEIIIVAIVVAIYFMFHISSSSEVD